MFKNGKKEEAVSPSQKTAEHSYGYYSKVLAKPFDTLEELEAAEKEHIEAEEEKKRLSLAKKEDASKVEEAWKRLNAAKKEYNEAVSEAKKEYVRKIDEARKAYSSVKDAQEDLLEKAEKEYGDALSEFNKAHPEGYHVTLKDGDSQMTISRKSTYDRSIVDNMFDWFFGNF